MKILIVDDEELNIKVVSAILENEGYEYASAENGVEAFKVLNEQSDIDAILLDRYMPEMDGIIFMKKLREHATYSNLPVIMATAGDSDKEVVDGFATGVYYYLTKPFDDRMLLSVLHSVQHHIADGAT